MVSSCSFFRGFQESEGAWKTTSMSGHLGLQAAFVFEKTPGHLQVATGGVASEGPGIWPTKSSPCLQVHGTY